MTTFCWLPPEKLRTSWSIDGVLMRSSSTSPVAALRSASRSRMPWLEIFLRSVMVMFSAQDMPSSRPCPLRSSVIRQSPCRTASLGEAISTRTPSTKISPAIFGSAPKMARAVSVRPLPTRPATPTISPFPTRSETSGVFALRRRPSTRSASPETTTSPRNASSPSMLRPTIMCTISGIVRPASGRVATSWPSRNTVTRSPTSKISCRRCEI